MKGKLLSSISLNGNQIDEQGCILIGKCHCRTYTHLHMDLECRYELTTQNSVIINFFLLFSEINLFYERLSSHSRPQVNLFLFVAEN